MAAIIQQDIIKSVSISTICINVASITYSVVKISAKY